MGRQLDGDDGSSLGGSKRNDLEKEESYLGGEEAVRLAFGSYTGRWGFGR